MLHEYHLIYSSILRMWSDLDIVPSTGCFFRGGREFAPYRLQAAKPDRLGVQPLQCMCSTETINWVQLCNPKTPIHIKHLLNKTIVEWEISTFSGMFIIWTGDGITSVGWFASRKKTSRHGSGSSASPRVAEPKKGPNMLNQWRGIANNR